ncbi:hypothetical protein C8J35_103537 [Rhizobium sp. PP-F2F-G38]|nr:hypothetical protein C8J35_103537 [Rhizobium sp. PP-F2F-G38]
MAVFLDFEAVGEVLTATGEAVPPALQIPEARSAQAMSEVRAARAELASKISWAFSYHDLTPIWTSDAKSRGRYGDLVKISKACSVIQELADSSKFGVVPSGLDLSVIMDGVARLSAAAEKERQRLKKAGFDKAAPLSGSKGASLLTPKDALISGLAEAYEFAYGVTPRITYNTEREAEGAFIRFCQVILEKGGEPMSAEAIRKAFGQRSKKRKSVSCDR